MKIRKPCVAGQFYPEDRGALLEMLAYCDKKAVKKELPEVKAVVVPHAGWLFSGVTAASAFKSVKNLPDVVIILGAVHRWGVSIPSIFDEGVWRTPLGDAEVDSTLSSILSSGMGEVVTLSTAAHDNEHSIEVNIPFVQYYYPSASIVPIAFPPIKNSFEIGKMLGEVLKKYEKSVLIVASTDLTHYGPSYGFTPVGIGEKAKAWVKDENDAIFIDYALSFKGDKVISHAEENQSACGAGAVAAAMGGALSLGASEGTLIDYTTSSDSIPESMRALRGGSDSNFVAYGAIAYY